MKYGILFFYLFEIAGEIVDKIWQNFQVFYVLVDEYELEIIENLGNIPREDAGVYLTGKTVH
ncbi:MAG: hypothetical protein F6K54_11005 [Okeania sp. SIO3B5]|uniref:hypothetical protein n=1 Tax=Okeania sp. SIO3B5 TaxID=2607811 RepID=UPI00140062DE|nr:hypothetical protein [Okeania sp. SIO3B5]NEO53562.1 hypothetical protein [Okeania sp. SIO3B5]